MTHAIRLIGFILPASLLLATPLAAAHEKNWVVVDMKSDWKSIHPARASAPVDR